MRESSDQVWGKQCSFVEDTGGVWLPIMTKSLYCSALSTVDQDPLSSQKVVSHKPHQLSPTTISIWATSSSLVVSRLEINDSYSQKCGILYSRKKMQIYRIELGSLLAHILFHFRRHVSNARRLIHSSVQLISVTAWQRHLISTYLVMSESMLRVSKGVCKASTWGTSSALIITRLKDTQSGKAEGWIRRRPENDFPAT
jgi:hypothetical protein